jgi:uncharacterized membrane protein
MSNTRTTYALTLIGYFGLVILLMLWNAWLSPSTHFPRAMVLIVLVGPLMLPLRGLLHGRPYTFSWSSYLALLYLALGVGDLTRPGERHLAALEIIFSLMMFVGAIFYARYRRVELKETEG